MKPDEISWITKPEEKPQTHKTLMALESVQEEGGGSNGQHLRTREPPKQQVSSEKQAGWSCACPKAYTGMLIKALFAVTKNWDQPRCPLRDGWLN